jgi:hypothetical protein
MKNLIWADEHPVQAHGVFALELLYVFQKIVLGDAGLFFMHILGDLPPPTMHKHFQHPLL